jgi:DNA-binding CsgD family transcriptional regulator
MMARRMERHPANARPQPAGSRGLRRARVEYTLTEGRLVGTVALPGQPPQPFASAAELERCLAVGSGRLLLVDATETPSPGNGLVALTTTERAIAEAAVEGASNREIAQSLFYSVKSIEAYLTRIYRRLGIDGREDLVALTEAEDLEPVDAECELIGGGASHGSPAPMPMLALEILVL